MATTIRRTGQAPLIFDGAEIAQQLGAYQAGKERNRWYDLILYSTNPDYVVVVEYHTIWEGEEDRTDVFAGGAPQVSAWLVDFNPLAPIRGFPAGPQYEERQAQLHRDIGELYASRVSDVLDKATEHDSKFAETVQESIESDYAVMDLETVLEFVRAQMFEFPLTTQEASAICDANNGAMLMHWNGLAINVLDADRLNGLGEKWGVDCQSMGECIQNADRGTRFAIMYAVAQFWRHCDLDTDEALKVAGFTITQED